MSQNSHTIPVGSANTGIPQSPLPLLPKTTTKSMRILIVDDEAPIREVMSASLKDEGHFVFTAHDGESGLQAIKEFRPEVVFLDIWMPGTMDGMEVLTAARKQFPTTDFVMISGHGTIETAVKATKLGAWDFIEKPLSMDKILIAITNLAQFQMEREEKEALLNRLRRSIAIIGETAKMMELKQTIARVAPQPTWVLITGEKGAGKSLVAQNIHYLSARAGRPFVEVVCANLEDDLVGPELLGYEAGALVGSQKMRRGKFELAEGGTLYFDEITEIPLKAQEIIVQILKDRKFKRVGGAEEIPFDVRIIGASSADTQEALNSGKLLPDLFHRLSAYPIQVPSLKDHPEDIPSLISHFSGMVTKEGGFQIKNFSERALQLMCKHPWIGNILELKNFIERLYILTPGEFVDVHDLRFAGMASESSADTTTISSFRDARAVFEKEFLVRKIQENSGNISKTAEVIGLERSYLHRKIRSYGIDAHRGDEDET